ncbi:MAG: aminotransferase class III-fold pyridoxal phosphate-dependent enzyme [Planctomycetota bacterium]
MPEPIADWLARDRAVLWHPYTQHGLEVPPLPVAGARGAELHLEGGEVLIDGISSWWATLHGHGEPRLVEAARRQMQQLDHVLFAGTTHEPAIRLAERLCALAPGDGWRVFYSDNGSTAVEVALKMVLQRHVLEGRPERRVFVALEGGYHGDTFGSMSVGDPDPFFEPFRPLLFETRRIAPDAGALRRALEELGDRAAGMIVEPMLQGAAGIRCIRPNSLGDARAMLDEADLPLIIGEVMTGFERTGRLFACEHAGIEPDLICLAKGLTGGTFPSRPPWLIRHDL